MVRLEIPTDLDTDIGLDVMGTKAEIVVSGEKEQALSALKEAELAAQVLAKAVEKEGKGKEIIDVSTKDLPPSGTASEKMPIVLSSSKTVFNLLEKQDEHPIYYPDSFETNSKANAIVSPIVFCNILQTVKIHNNQSGSLDGFYSTPRNLTGVGFNYNINLSIKQEIQNVISIIKLNEKHKIELFNLRNTKVANEIESKMTTINIGEESNGQVINVGVSINSLLLELGLFNITETNFIKKSRALSVDLRTLLFRIATLHKALIVNNNFENKIANNLINLSNSKIIPIDVKTQREMEFFGTLNQDGIVLDGTGSKMETAVNIAVLSTVPEIKCNLNNYFVLKFDQTNVDYSNVVTGQTFFILVNDVNQFNTYKNNFCIKNILNNNSIEEMIDYLQQFFDSKKIVDCYHEIFYSLDLLFQGDSINLPKIVFSSINCMWTFSYDKYRLNTETSTLVKTHSCKLLLNTIINNAINSKLQQDAVELGVRYTDTNSQLFVTLVNNFQNSVKNSQNGIFSTLGLNHIVDIIQYYIVHEINYSFVIDLLNPLNNDTNGLIITTKYKVTNLGFAVFDKYENFNNGTATYNLFSDPKYDFIFENYESYKNHILLLGLTGKPNSQVYSPKLDFVLVVKRPKYNTLNWDDTNLREGVYSLNITNPNLVIVRNLITTSDFETSLNSLGHRDPDSRVIGTLAAAALLNVASAVASNVQQAVTNVQPQVNQAQAIARPIENPTNLGPIVPSQNVQPLQRPNASAKKVSGELFDFIFKNNSKKRKHIIALAKNNNANDSNKKKENKIVKLNIQGNWMLVPSQQWVVLKNSVSLLENNVPDPFRPKLSLKYDLTTHTVFWSFTYEKQKQLNKFNPFINSINDFIREIIKYQGEIFYIVISISQK